ncbi:MAG: cytochrome b [Candidatus Tokpelaia sp.]|nr:MAG: cytochrome b [Candidatus Tokpelaia sp.]KAA6206542.1 MAG: cytochrome b [Candidatus Tokpelaia sp.]
MSLAPGRQSVAAYNHGAMLLHWLIALLIIAELSLGYLMKHYTILPEMLASAFYQSRFTFYQSHKTFGIMILLLTLMRLAWRFLYKPPVEPPIGKAEKAATQIVTFLFYALMILVPLLGWAVSSTTARKLPILLFGNPHFVWPLLPPQLTLFSHLQAEWLHLVLAYSLAFLLFLHIGGALKHQFYSHIPIMARMLPGHNLQAQKASKTVFLLLFLAVFCLAAIVIYCASIAKRQAETAQTAALPAQEGQALPGAAPITAPAANNHIRQ